MSAALFTDLYELTMAEAYLAEEMHGEAAFELFFRRLPPQRNYAIAAGLEPALEHLETLRFSPEDLDYLRGLGRFGDRLLERLERFRFSGEVWAVPEGTAIFGNEPILRVVAPILEAQIVETWLLSRIHVDTLIATKAARIVDAAAGRPVVDFGARRAHGIDAALSLARSSYLAGAAGTSLVEAGRRWGIPVFGTMAHSYVQAHDDEADAFEAFARVHPHSTLLVDTWDTLAGVDEAIALTRGDRPIVFDAIRLDSGDLGALAREARRRLDAAGLPHVRIVASSELDEHAIAALVRSGAPIDAFGVGTSMATSKDAPVLDVVYKLVEYGGRGRAKFSATKVLHPGRKQIFRSEVDGRYAGDVIGRHDEELPGTPLLRPVMRGGRRLPEAAESLDAIRARVRRELERLPPSIRALDPAQRPYPVVPSAALQSDLERIRAQLC